MLNEESVRNAILSGLNEQSEKPYDAPYVRHNGGDIWLVDGWVNVRELAAHIIKEAT